MAIEQFGGQAQFAADLAHFVLVERFQRLHDAARFDQLLNAGHAVVMRLDEGGLGGAAGFDRVRIDGALAENPVLVEQAARFDDALLHAHELFADDVALALRLADARERLEKLLFGVLHGDARHAADEFGFAFAHQAGIHIDAAHAAAPSARRHSVKATVESTPPLTKKKTLRLPTRFADLLLQQGTRRRGFQSFTHPQTRKTKFRDTRVPRAVWTTSGWNWTP